MKRSSGVYGLRGGSSKEAEEEMTDRARTGGYRGRLRWATGLGWP